MQVFKWVTLGAGMIFILIVAAYLNAPHLYYMAAILLTLPAVSYSLGWYALRGLKFSRIPPEAGWTGEEGVFVYVAKNSTTVPRFFLAIHESLPPWIEPLDAEPPLFNVDGRPGSSPDEHGEAHIAHRVRYRKRGAFALTGFEVTAIDPLGVFAFSSHVACEGEVVVYPRAEPMDSFTLSGADRYGWQEFTAAALRGASVDPDGVREYAPGDPLRHIHWRQTARTGSLAVIEFEEPQTVNLVIALDLQEGTEVGDDTHTTLEKGVSLATSLAQQAIQAGASVRLILPDDAARDERGIGSFGAAGLANRGQDQLLSVLDALARAEARSARPISAVVNETVGNLLPGTTLVVVTANADADLADAISRYTSAQTRVGVVYIDPSAFNGKAHRNGQAQTEQFFSQILAVHAHPFLMHRAAPDEPTPETILHGSY
jgi:uncharacterized protein (DUF58 family)